MKKRYSELFSIENGAVTPKVPIHINGITMGPGVSFGRGVLFGGVDLTALIGKDLEVEIQNGVYIITGYYN
ncbi:MAG: hypothetical protein K2G35_02755 [Duncaniella sp.]|nr:hypothetical protein [Duncaniella sp.]